MDALKIIIAGPPGTRGFLEKLASEVISEKAEIDLQLGLVRPTDASAWSAANVFVSFGVPCSGADMDAAPGLRAIITPSLGYEGIDVEAAQSRGIAFANGRVAENFESVAEAAMLLMLTAMYRLRDAEARLRQGDVRSGPPRARMLKGKTVGIIGDGNIAKALIRRLEGWIRVSLPAIARSFLHRLPLLSAISTRSSRKATSPCRSSRSRPKPTRCFRERSFSP